MYTCALLDRVVLCSSNAQQLTGTCHVFSGARPLALQPLFSPAPVVWFPIRHNCTKKDALLFGPSSRLTPKPHAYTHMDRSTAAPHDATAAALAAALKSIKTREKRLHRLHFRRALFHRAGQNEAKKSPRSRTTRAARATKATGSQKKGTSTQEDDGGPEASHTTHHRPRLWPVHQQRWGCQPIIVENRHHSPRAQANHSHAHGTNAASLAIAGSGH